MGYRLPSNTAKVSCSHACHRRRNPPSREPGTDYASAYGSPLFAVGNGTVVDLQDSTANATGRYITIDLDDGRRTRSLHLSHIGVRVGERVTAGQRIGRTGASGFGREWGYGAHVHQTLWPTHTYAFDANATIDFARHVSRARPKPKQRVVGPNGANGRPGANTKGAVTRALEPGTFLDCDGWRRGQKIEGNDVWFRAAGKRDWFWSGGFTGRRTDNLPDRTPVKLGKKQRRVGGAGANGRPDPSTTGAVTRTLEPKTVCDLDGWITGEKVEDNDVWFKLAGSDDWFWSGGFTGRGTSDLRDLNEMGATRTVGESSSNIRPQPSTAVAPVGSEDPGAEVAVAAWTHGEEVGGNDVWFQRADERWQWSGGFTSASTDGLDEVPTPVTAALADADNPRGLETYQPVYPGAFAGLCVPLGYTDCQNPVTRTPRDRAGTDRHAVTPVIDTYIVHWTASLEDQLDWFSRCNPRSVAPTWYMRRDGTVCELIRPGTKPAATGPDWNWRSVAVETLAAPGADFTDSQWESHARLIAWLAGHDGKKLDGVRVRFSIDREHVKGHRECLPGATECPGDAQVAGLDALLVRARAILDSR